MQDTQAQAATLTPEQLASLKQATASPLAITKDKLKVWSACVESYKWFLEKYPQGGEFADVYEALQDERKYDDAGWLVERVFADLGTADKVQQTVRMAGADASKIAKIASEGGEAATTGYWAHAATTGYGANAATTGDRANAATTGDRANAATTGYGANAATTGDRANAATTGEGANAATTGYGANAATTGYGANAATTGEGAVAAALGIQAKAKAGADGAIVLVHRDDIGKLLHIFASKVGENGITADVWYQLDASGKAVEASE